MPSAMLVSPQHGQVPHRRLGLRVLSGLPRSLRKSQPLHGFAPSAVSLILCHRTSIQLQPILIRPCRHAWLVESSPLLPRSSRLLSQAPTNAQRHLDLRRTHLLLWPFDLVLHMGALSTAQLLLRHPRRSRQNFSSARQRDLTHPQRSRVPDAPFRIIRPFFLVRYVVRRSCRRAFLHQKAHTTQRQSGRIPQDP